MNNPFPVSADTDAWQIGEAEVEDQPLLIRIRPQLTEFDGRSAFPQKLMIRWDYGNDGQSGMPDAELTEDMAFWEDALVPAFEENSAGILAYVLTYHGVREWHIYFSDIDQMQAALNDALAGMYPMPLTMEATEDAEWSDYTSLMNCMSSE